jgi:hypothetical protein
LPYNLYLSALNFEQTLMVTSKQGGTTKAAVSGVIEMIDNMIHYNLFLITI